MASLRSCALGGVAGHRVVLSASLEIFPLSIVQRYVLSNDSRFLETTLSQPVFQSVCQLWIRSPKVVACLRSPVCLGVVCGSRWPWLGLSLFNRCRYPMSLAALRPVARWGAKPIACLAALRLPFQAVVLRLAFRRLLLG